MISHQHKFIFVHIPKTAGTSIEYELLKMCGVDFDKEAFKTQPFPLGDLPNNIQRSHRLGGEQHRALREFKDWPYYKFSVVRHPWDRFLSEYRYLTRLRRIHVELDVFAKTPRLWEIMPPKHVVPQSQFFTPNSLDKVCRFENLQTDFDEVCAALSFPKSRLPFLNTTSKIIPFHTPEARDTVLEYYKEDMGRFGYE